ncbi:MULTISPECIES: NADH:flavin oxidoreductase/NADH oxidase [unclassified Haladaptatus]|uniref:NADH:flavin oxidoreductase/NADH oxidase n=1 Tax=unclassified Haladaptatus TaxID=2622732 RepID=UPI00209C17AE|nr:MULTISPECIES: NADH:flavin oxidoreductase/NADH oxidase [unclassified Haladaptatus]MCO8246623.1 NADH:flavin oxidoreductase/NADH oxidase [Haladaptatus sp. AB643]MCO8256253.1 NADH:flavin oxidoreductase/NADH oxidase [Haladaptatus sp. AB618]
MTDDLFSSVTFRESTARNRVMVSPMCQYSCAGDGLATDWHHVHLGSRATGGAGIVMTEATAVEPRGRISPDDLGIWSDEHADALAPTAEFIRDRGALPAIQLAHAGRKASKTSPWDGNQPLQPDDDGWETIAPSPEPWPYDDTPPELREMTTDDIATVVDSFASAAERALDAGFEIAEVHAAHGYLLHEFLSPVTNRREDEYGGSLENRTRIVREVTEAVREVWPDDKPVFVRISATDWLPDRESWTIEDSVHLSEELHDLGADLIDVSAGGLHPDQQIPNPGPNYQVPFAERIREDTDIPVGAVGGITEPAQADALIRNGRGDLAIIGREHLRDPYFTLHAAAELDAEDRVEWPRQYRRAV